MAAFCEPCRTGRRALQPLQGPPPVPWPFFTRQARDLCPRRRAAGPPGRRAARLRREEPAPNPKAFVRTGGGAATHIKLDEEQRRAVEHGDGPLLIVAGPGSGKTRVLTERVRHLVDAGRARPEEVLCLTFTEKAAGEMSRRLEAYGMDTASMDVRTFHSFAMRVLEDNELDTGLDMRGGIIEKAEGAVWAINHVDDFGLQSVEVGNNAPAVMRSIMDGISSFARELKTPDDIDRYVAERSPGKDDLEREELASLADLSRVYRKYQEFKRRARVVDYDDLVAEAARLLGAKPSIRRRYRGRYKHVLVDELQDNNVAQFKLARLLAENGNITAVGDEDQAIYAFQGGYRRIFDDFKSTFRGTREARLTTNYRSTENIVRVTNDWMAGIAGAGDAKRLHSAGGEDGEKIIVAECDDDRAEARYVAEKIAEMAGRPSDRGGPGGKGARYTDIAVLTRRRIDGEKFEEALSEKGIPAKYVGSTDLLYAPAVRDLMAHIKTAAEPATSGAEITQLMKLHGITERNIARINRAAKASMFGGGGEGGDCVMATVRDEGGHARPRTSQEAEMIEFKEKLDRLVEIGRGSLPVGRAVHKIMMSVSGLYRRAVLDDSRQGKTRRWQLGEIYRIADAYERLYDGATLAGFVRHLYQMGEQEGESRESLATENAVEITTIHQSKGREFEAVFVADVSARKLPVAYRRRKFDVPEGMSEGGGRGGGSEDGGKELHLEEERRLLYVAMTRAKSRLFITHAKRYGGNAGESKPSAFLGSGEIDAANSPRIGLESYGGGGAREAAEEPGVVERLTRDTQAMAIAAVSGMSLKTAVRRIVELSKIKHYADHNTLAGFDPGAVLAFGEEGAGDQGGGLDAELEGSGPAPLDAGSIKLSASKIEMYRKCPLQFKFCHILHVPGMAGGPIHVGVAVHAVLEKIAKRRMNGETTSEEQALELLERRWVPTNFGSKKNADEYWAKAKSMVRTFMEWDEKEAARGATVVGAEQKFELELDGLKFAGKIDRVDREPDGRYAVIDYKTGKPGRSKTAGDVQMSLYALAAKGIYGELPARAMQLFVRDGREVPNAVDAEAVARERASIMESARAILNEEFPAKPDYMACGWCDYMDICDDRHPRAQRRR